jgi:hypothetical protein
VSARRRRAWCLSIVANGDHRIDSRRSPVTRSGQERAHNQEVERAAQELDAGGGPEFIV